MPPLLVGELVYTYIDRDTGKVGPGNDRRGQARELRIAPPTQVAPPTRIAPPTGAHTYLSPLWTGPVFHQEIRHGPAELLGLDEDEKAILDAYFPNPLVELSEFEDSVVDELNEKFVEVTNSVNSVIGKVQELNALIFNGLSRCIFNDPKTGETTPTPATIEEAMAATAHAITRLNKRAKVHVFEQKIGSMNTFELAALVVPPTGLLTDLKSFFGFKVTRLVLPKDAKKVVDVLQDVLQKSAELADDLKGLEASIDAMHEGQDDDIKSWKKDTDQDIGGKSKLT